MKVFSIFKMNALNNMNYIKIVIFYNRQKLDITVTGFPKPVEFGLI